MMRVYEIKTPDGQTFYTNSVFGLLNAPVGSKINVLEMTERQYATIPSTVESTKFFAR